MPRYNVTYRCGHTRTENLHGRIVERNLHIKRMQYLPCPECRIERSHMETSLAAAKNAEQGLPELSGSKKQVAWAELIRQTQMIDATRTVEAVLRLARYYAEAGNISPRTRQAKEAEQMARMNALREIDDAKWWIEHRKKYGQRLLEAAEAAPRGEKTE